MNLIHRPINDFGLKDDTYSLRGIAMLMIIFHHVWQIICRLDYDPTPLLTGYVILPAGSLGTGLFFFLSGYGIYKSLIRQKKLTIRYLILRLRKMILPFIFCFFLIIVIIYFFIPNMFNYQLAKDFFSMSLPTNNIWFLKVIIGLYIVVFFVFKLKINLNTKVTIVCLLCFCYFILAMLTLPTWWWSSILNYPLGMLIAWRYHVYNKYRVSIIIILSLFMVIVAKLGFQYIVLETMLFSIIILESVRLININNRILNFIGKESLSFYLFQMLFLFIGVKIGLSSNWILFALEVFIGTFILSYVYSLLNCYKNKVKLLI